MVDNEHQKNEGGPTPEIQKLFGRGYKLDMIVDGLDLPVGGHILSDEHTMKVKVDKKALQEFLDKAVDLSQNANVKKIGEWLESVGADVDPELYSRLYAFAASLRSTYQRNPNAYTERSSSYRSGTPRLSEMMEVGSYECAEIAAMAQLYLQELGIESSYVSGAVLWNKEHEYSEDHSYIVLKAGDKEYVYDPTNPTAIFDEDSQTQRGVPSLYELVQNFSQLPLDQKVFVEAKNIANQKSAFLGVDDGTNILPKHMILKDTVEQG